MSDRVDMDEAGIYELDVGDYLCPFPVLKAAKVMRALPPLSVLRVMARDAGSWEDFVAFAAQAHHRLLTRRREKDRFIFLLQKHGV